MNSRKSRFRKKNHSHQQLIDKGFSLEHPTKKQPKGCITSVEFGSNGRRYYQVIKMTKFEKKVFTDSDKRKKAGKEIWFTYRPNSLMIDFMFKYHLDIKKDKQGNVTVTISKATKGKKK